MSLREPQSPTGQRRNGPLSRSRTLAAAASLAATALLVSNAAGPASAATQSVAAAKTVVVTTHQSTLGTYLTNRQGRAMYLWVADPKGASVCTGTCAKFWPPVTGTPTAAGGVKQSGLGTLTRADGTTQATYHGHALYYFLEDKKAGSAVGQGSDAFDAKWWVVSTAGEAVTTAAVVVTTHKGKLGTYLTDGSGRTVYLWVADPKGKSVCTGKCATFWPPVLGSPQALGAVAQAGLGTLTRAGGKKQVTYKGHALYYFSLDKKAGQTLGQGSDGFNAKWWVLTTAGKAITKS
jgi:predicted lipoprotein with Yx(FWY)xxD motif